MYHNGLDKLVQGKDLEYVQNFVNAANKGQSNNFIGVEVVVDLIIALRNCNERIKELEYETNNP